MRMPYSNLIIVAILSLLLPSSVIFTAMTPSSVISNQIESLFVDDKDKINFFLTNINDGSRNVLLEQASAQESESDVVEEVESSTDAQEEEENVPSPPPQENIGNKTVVSPRNQPILTPISINNSNSTNATTTVPINNNTNTTGLNGTPGNPITISKTFPLKGTSGLDVTITITPIINGPELSGVTNVRKESDGPANPPLRQEFSYYMPFSMLPSEHQQQILAANPGTVAQGSSSSPPPPLPSSSPPPSPSTYNRQTAEGVTPALLTTTTTEEDSGGGQLGEGNKDNDSYDIVPVQILEGLTKFPHHPVAAVPVDEIKSVAVVVWKGIEKVQKIHDYLDRFNLLDAFGAHLKEMEHIQGCLNYLSDSELSDGASNSLTSIERQEYLKKRQQYIDAAVENMKSMYENKGLHQAFTAVIGRVPMLGKLVGIAYMATDIQKWIDYEWDKNIENALDIAKKSAGCKEFPKSMTVAVTEILAHPAARELKGEIELIFAVNLQFPKVGLEATKVTGTGNLNGHFLSVVTLGSYCIFRAEEDFTGNVQAFLEKTPGRGIEMTIVTTGNLSPRDAIGTMSGEPSEICDAFDPPPFPIANQLQRIRDQVILPPAHGSYTNEDYFEITWHISGVDHY
jgi:hypothetical protein